MYKNIFITSATENSPSTVHIWDDEHGYLTMPWSKFNYAYERDGTGTYTSIYGHRLKKVKTFGKDVNGLFEADLPRETRVLTDLYLKSDDVSVGHVVLTFDIEVSMASGLPDRDTANNPITAIATHDSATDEYRVFVLNATNTPIRPTESVEHIECHFDNERDLLLSFLEYWEQVSPTIITGWNIANFDVPYLIRRLKRVLSEHDAMKVSPIGLIKYQPQRDRYQIAGVSTLDYLEMYKKFSYTQQPTYRLDAIGELEVQTKKTSYDGTLQQLYERDLNTFIDYNVNDVRIVVKLDEKLRYIDLVRQICHTGHVGYEDFSMSSRFIEGTIVTYLHRKGIICPNKPLNGREQMNLREENDEEGFSGAYVMEPDPGLYEWVYSLDLQSLYPSIIMSLNISSETKCGRVYDWDIDKHIKNEVLSYELEIFGQHKKLTKAEFQTFMTQSELCISSNGILYKSPTRKIVGKILQSK